MIQTVSSFILCKIECLITFPFFAEYTFIVLDKEIFQETSDEVQAMVGDVNLFLLPEDTVTGEITIMIAEQTARRKGFGHETLLLMMNYCIKELNVGKFIALIGEQNEGSVKLFEKLNFRHVEKTYFGEKKFERMVDESEWEHFLAANELVYEESHYERQGSDKR